MAAGPDEGRPVLTGLIALVGVGLVVGLLVSGVALAGTSVLGLGDDGGSGGDATSAESMYLPTPSPTPSAAGALVTLLPATQDTATADPTEEESKAPDDIALSASVTTVQPGVLFDLSGVYPGGEGVTLTIERAIDGDWELFPVTTTVSNETFSVPVQTSKTGQMKFRVRDDAAGKVSNEVTVTVG